MIPGTIPSLSYFKTSNESSRICSGIKNPVSVLEINSISSVSRLILHTLETPV